MKHWIVAGVMSGALSLASPPATQAGDEGWAAFGGLIGGALLGEVLHGSHHASHHSVVHETRVVVQEPVYEVYVEPAGHYQYVKKRVFVPGYYTYRNDRCGRSIKVWTPGYYTFQTHKVWVELGYRGGHHGGHGTPHYRASHRRHH